MPELPEVETVRRGLEAHLPRRRLATVELRRPDLRWPIPTAAVQALAGRTLRQVRRRAKYLLLDFGGRDPQSALVHLGMSGRLFVDVMGRGASDPPWIEHEHWRMGFSGRLLRYLDPRRFGALDVAATDGLAEHPLLRDLGPEPLSEAFDGELLFQATRRRRVGTKTFLMNAHNVVGVGNIYASEACFRAGVRPRRAAGRLSRADCQRLVEGVRSVLSEALTAGGTTLRDYRGVDQDAGYFRRRLDVYEREGEPCRRCRSAIRRVVDGARSTYYCPGCQR